MSGKRKFPDPYEGMTADELDRHFATTMTIERLRAALRRVVFVQGAGAWLCAYCDMEDAHAEDCPIPSLLGDAP